jgi:hypothetical protein
MFVGHLGVGLGLKKIDDRINLGWIFLASLFPDILLGILILFGLEELLIPANYDQLHYLEFSFPYSHGVIAIVLWTGIVYFLANKYWPKVDGQRTKAGFIFAAAIFLHFVSDLIVHIPDIPISGNNSAKIGFGLWNYMTIALTFEMILVVTGLLVYLSFKKTRTFRSTYGIITLIVVLSALNIMGQTIAPAPENVTGPAISFIAQPIIIAGIAFWLDKRDK